MERNHNHIVRLEIIEFDIQRYRYLVWTACAFNKFDILSKYIQRFIFKPRVFILHSLTKVHRSQFSDNIIRSFLCKEIFVE